MGFISVNPLVRSRYPYLVLAILLGMAGIYGFNRADAAPAVAPPAPSVDVVVLAPQEIRSWANFSGRLAPVETAAIKPLVSGTIQKVLFTDGQQVKKGQALFVIDPRPHQASVKRAQAQLATAQSRQQLAQHELRRTEQLLTSKLVSQSIYDAALSAHRVAQADVKQAEAALSQAQLDLEYAHISAPIDGRVGRAELTAGNVVEAGANAPVLTQIVATDKFYAEFNVDEANYIQFVRNTHNQNAMPVEMNLASDEQVTYQGYISSFDNHLDASSGTIRARALFENKDGALTAGLFANVRLGSADTSKMLLVPERAIGTNQSKKYVLVVDENNTAVYREVTLGDNYQGQRIVLTGVNEGDRVIVNGLSHVRPNTPVNPAVAQQEQILPTLAVNH